MADKRKKIGIGLLGSGVVGQAVQDFVFGDGDLPVELVKIYTRRPKGKKWHKTHPALFTDKPEEVVDHPDAAIVVEALGFHDDKELAGFKDLILRALKNGKSVVTSDKAVLARYGAEIWEAARKHGGDVRFEACVGGGVPIVRSIGESFAAEEPEAIYGIVNGTSNYILTEMSRGGKSYAAALKEAQEKGYAETNPSSDVSGKDAEAKLILLAAVTFGLQAQPGAFWRKGIEAINAIDFQYGRQKGRSTIKSVAVASALDGSVQAYVSPVLVRDDHFLAAIDGATNAIFFRGKRSGASGRDWSYAFAGPGAGGGPTAIAVLGDVLDLARGKSRGEFVPLVKPGKLSIQAEDKISAGFYLRFIVKDRAGIVGDICQTLGESGINISEIWQLSHSRGELQALAASYRIDGDPETILPFVITLERSSIGQIKNAMKVIGRRDYMLAEPLWFPIWN
ncbi:MAG TPA: homoserine dehydrogenase [Candidatus Binatia bacterium]|jgi:homoserine dehydrogenase